MGRTKTQALDVLEAIDRAIDAAADSPDEIQRLRTYGGLTARQKEVQEEQQKREEEERQRRAEDARLHRLFDDAVGVFAGLKKTRARSAEMKAFMEGLDLSAVGESFSLSWQQTGQFSPPLLTQLAELQALIAARPAILAAGKAWLESEEGHVRDYVERNREDLEKLGLAPKEGTE